MGVRPVGNGMIGGAIGLSIHPGHVKAVTERVQSHHTVPHGTDAIVLFQALRARLPSLCPYGTKSDSARDKPHSPDFTWLSAIHHYPCRAVAQRQPCNCSPYPLRFEFVAAQPPDDSA